MTNKERIDQLEALVKQLEQRVVWLEQKPISCPYTPPPIDRFEWNKITCGINDISYL